ncbi:MAG: elongation factor G, partial [Proteobacteria bacterium]|nr:elongation factor G [Pseudomonadota bacterium]
MSKSPSGPRCAVITGTYLSGKTTLLENILFTADAIHRKGSVSDGNTVGDNAPEARDRQMSVELNVASTQYLGEDWTFIDCPGSVELLQETLNAATVADIVVAVCEPGRDKAMALTRVLKDLDARDIPYIVFINKIDAAEASVQETVDALREFAERPLIMREIPIREGEQVTGFVDLASMRAYRYSDDGPQELDGIPEDVADRVTIERTTLLESLSDFDDTLLERLLEDETPPVDEVFDYLAQAVKARQIAPVFFGAAVNGNGIVRLLKALRHETPDVAESADRMAIDASGEPLAQIIKTSHAGQTGKMSIGRVWRGEFADGQTYNGSRVSGLFTLMGQQQEKQPKAVAGQVVAFGRMDEIKTGDILSPSGKAEGPALPAPLHPVYALAIHANRREDEVKMTDALHKLLDEDTSLTLEANPDTHELVLRGQGDTHLQIAIDRLGNRNKLSIASNIPQVAYKGSIRKPVSQHARHKKQSGGHGQFGDVHVEIKPLPRGSGFLFDESVKGGVVPKQYIPAVETGVRDYLAKGPLGFPVVDVAVELVDGQAHAVDSSEQAFKTAGSLAMSEG